MFIVARLHQQYWLKIEVKRLFCFETGKEILQKLQISLWFVSLEIVARFLP